MIIIHIKKHNKDIFNNAAVEKFLFVSLCCLHKGSKVKCQKKRQLGQHITNSPHSQVLSCPLSLPFLFFPLLSVEYAPAGSNEETWGASPPPPHESTNTPPLYGPSFVDSSSSLSINIHCSVNNTARPVWFDGRGTHFNSRKLSHPLLEVISGRMIDVD